MRFITSGLSLLEVREFDEWPYKHLVALVSVTKRKAKESFPQITQTSCVNLGLRGLVNRCQLLAFSVSNSSIHGTKCLEFPSG